MQIHFITSNPGKAKLLQSYFETKGWRDIEIVPTNLHLIEPQADSVAEVSLFKARQAYEQLKQPVLVEDGGVAIDALNGFPGVYTKYSNGTLGAEGFIKLMAGESNRRAKFVSTATYIDAIGTEHQFHRRGGDFLIADKVSPVDSPLAWSVMWKIIYVERYHKVLAEMTADEVNEYYSSNKSEGSLNVFADWLMESLSDKSGRPDLIDDSALTVTKKKIGEIDTRDKFFDSLRESYGGIEFDNWLKKKSQEEAYVCYIGDALKGFLYLKQENQDEDYSDITPILPPKKRLKIGTFKVNLNRQNLGKRFFQIVFENAANMNVDEIYGTVFDSDTNGWQKQALVKLVLDLGFYRWGVKSTGETVYVRNMLHDFCRDKPTKTFPFF